MIHMYLSSSMEVTDPIRDAVATDSDISTMVYARIRASSKKECYFEWNMGSDNSQIETSVFVRGWKRFIELRYQQLKEEFDGQ